MSPFREKKFRILLISLLFLGISGDTVELQLGTASAFNRVLPGYIGFVLSFQNQAPLWDNTSIITIDLENPEFLSLVRSLAPALVRVGGGAEWQIVMNVHGTECKSAKTDADFCLTMPRWKEILQFAKDTGIQLIWGLGAQNRANHSSPLDFSNIDDFLTFTASLGEDILANADGSKGGLLGFEMGNELDGGDYTTSTSVDPKTFANDYKTLRRTINALWTKTRPLLVGPAMHIQATWERRFLAHLGRGILDLFSFHVYVLYGPDPLLRQKIMDPDFLDAYWDQAEPVVKLAQALQPGADIMIGETSAAWHSGQCGVTDRFYGSFWYADVLGRSARGGIQGFARHNFNGGCYAMINRTDMKPNPDYWIGKIWRELMGEEVLDVREIIVETQESVGFCDDLRIYAHKSRRFPKAKSGGAGATLVFIRLDHVAYPCEINLSDYANLMAPRYEYRITGYPQSSNVTELLSSRNLALNGELLESVDQILSLSRFVNDSTVPIMMENPAEILFVELIDARIY